MSIVRNGKDGFIKIGNVVKTIRASKSPHLIPIRYLPEPLSATLTQHLQWILQKDALGQDVFLIGPPGKSKRQLALMYSELTHQEVEYISLSRDVTESDLKQRREIRSGSAVYADECAVRAALEGRLLILEGLEKAERNVLPVLNNLLENREVQLEDGRFIMHPSRFDFLLDKHGSKTMEDWRLLRCSPHFRVMALGLPVPRYRGNPLDPPLRSRFQCRRVRPEPALPADRPPADKLLQLTSFGMAVNAEEARSLALPDFPLDNLAAVAQLWNLLPAMPVQYWLQRLYPFDGALSREAADAVKTLTKKFELPTQLDHANQLSLVGVTASQSADGASATASESEAGEATARIRLQASLLSKQVDLKVSTGPWNLPTASNGGNSGGFVDTRYHSGLLADLLVSHAGNHDFALIGPRGCGKSTAIGQLARLLGYPVTHVVLYKDMSSRDLLQQRITDAAGDTQWRPSALVQAAVEGHLAVLDGLHRIDPGTFSVLHRLLQDRELALFDGTRLLRHDRYDELQAEYGWTDADMAARRLLRIHPAFRVVGVGELSPARQQANQWLSAEMLTAFLFHSVRALSAEEEAALLLKLVPDSEQVQAPVQRLVEFAHRLRNSSDPSHVSLAGSLSTRQLVRLARCVAADPQVGLRDLLERACLSRFLPRLAAQTLAQCLDEAGFQPSESTEADRPISCDLSPDGGELRIGSATARLPPELRNEMKIPETLFYDNQTHLRVLEAMLRDFSLGEHLLLIGNQGVGKNKLADHFLRLLRRPREYVQLHRDTTVHSLTLQPTVQDGRIAYQDSPLVRACRLGHVLVVDEADKAPTHVTCVLKSLAESGEMALPDGRRIVPPGWTGGPSDQAGLIRTHPDFRLLVLANRPGFPFLGNDFFGALGDTFACHPVDNPRLDSELHMLSQYGPDVNRQVLEKLVNVFADLRAMSDEGNLQYPYSTRELVNVVRHLQKFPGERLSSVLQNVFDFDSHNPELRATLAGVLARNGIPADSVDHASVKLSKQLALPSPALQGSSNLVPANRSSPFLAAAQAELTLKGPADLPASTVRLDAGSGRSHVFTELESFVRIPLEDTDGLSDICVTYSDDGQPSLIHAATVNPLRLYSLAPGSGTATLLDLADIFPNTGNFYKPRVHLLSMGTAMPHAFLLHEEMTNVLLLVDAKKRQAARVRSRGLPEHPLATNRNLWRRPTLAKGSAFRLTDSLGLRGCPVLFLQGRDQVELLDLQERWSLSLQLPGPIKALHPLSENSWLVQFANDESRHHILLQSREEPTQFSLLQLESPELLPQKIQWSSPLSGGLPSLQLPPEAQLAALATPNSHVTLLSLAPPNAEGLHQLSLHLIQPLADEAPAAQDNRLRDPMYGSGGGGGGGPASEPRFSQFFPLPGGRGLVRCRPTAEAPPAAFRDGRLPVAGTAGVLEVTDLHAGSVSYLAVEPTGASLHRMAGRPASWMVSDLPRLMAQPAGRDLLSADQSGALCLWQVEPAGIETALAQWHRLLGDEKAAGGMAGQRRMLIERRLPPGSRSLSGPKHGKLDPSGAPHVGGNQWAGGTGGRDTAGLGGVGGPYRLDAGHHVYQVPDEVKEAVPPEISEAAREMARKAWRERLREIEMSEHDGELYDTYLKRVRPQVTALRAVLQALEAKGKERSWLRHQTQGDLDDGKLIEGLVGERSVYRRRGERPPELGAPPEKPKLVRVLVDVSGSMYRFNGTDQRLERQMEACLMLMEAFEGFEAKFAYEFRGHSGEGPDWSFTSAVRPPANQKQRLDALKAMLAHAQFCMSGDHTVEAIDTAVRQLAAAEADERFLLVFSDANLDRYGIHPRHLSRALTQEPKVTACAIFLGTLGNQATFLRESLPSGHAFVCLDNANLPHILQQFFTSTLLATD